MRISASIAGQFTTVEGGRMLDRSAEETHDAEQQVRLSLDRRERAEQCQHVGVAGDG
jgi:hypothetical protein